MRKIRRIPIRLLLILFFVLTSLLPIPAYRDSQTIFAWNSLPLQPQINIPEATQQTTPVELQWWQQTRAAGKEFAIATERKQKAILKALNKYFSKPAPYDERDLLPEKELTGLNGIIESTREKYVGLLKEGADRAYRVPIANSRPMILQITVPRYTEEGRQQKISGVVVATVQFLADGTFGEIEIKRGLGYGLDQSAVDSVRGIVFLPAIKDGKFVAFSQQVQIEFNIK